MSIARLIRGDGINSCPYKQIEQDPFDLIGVFGGLLGVIFLLFPLIYAHPEPHDCFYVIVILSILVACLQYPIFVFHGALGRSCDDGTTSRHCDRLYLWFYALPGSTEL